MDKKQHILSPELAQRLAAIDIGSNSVRLVVAEPLRDGTYRILDEEKETTRLSKTLGSTGRLDPEAVELSIDALRRMKQIAAGFQVTQIRVIATCAVREAVDGADFCRRVKEELDLDIEIISSEEEGRLAFLSVSRNFPLEGKNVLVADIGGGSTELILASGNLVERIYGTPLGAVRVTELQGASGQMTPPQSQKMLDWIDLELQKYVRKILLPPHVLIGSGGTFTTLAEMIMARKGQERLPLRGYEITRAEVRHLFDDLAKMSPKARKGLPGLSADRADIIVAGVGIIDRIMQRFELNRLQVHDRGVRDGLLLTMIDSTLGTPGPEQPDPQSTIERFAATCGVDLNHTRHVARLAGLIFSQLVESFSLAPEDGRLLEAAAYLQDVGYLIDYEKHHKHSYHLILHSRLAGFQPRELEIIANLARYHRGSEPKKKHENFSRLSGKDRNRVRKLAAILRLAGGFDRSNTRQVQSVIVQSFPELSEVLFTAVAAEEPEVDLWGARRRAAPFENAFDVTLRVDWQPAPQAAQPVTE